MLAGIDILMKKKLQLYSGKIPGVQLFFIDDSKDFRDADLLVLPGGDMGRAAGIIAPDGPPLICYGASEHMGLCMAAGCVDYLCSPWSAEEFFERVQRGRARGVIETGGCRLELVGDGRLSLETPAGAKLFSERLSHDEQRVLRLFIRNRGSFFSRGALSEFLGGTAVEDSRKIDMLISRLRKKISSLIPEIRGSEHAVSVVSTKSGSGWGILS